MNPFELRYGQRQEAITAFRPKLSYRTCASQKIKQCNKVIKVMSIVLIAITKCKEISNDV